ncbi:MAG: queuosine precursor transporter [Pseudomonadota bacterium]
MTRSESVLPFILIMAAVVLASNILVQYPFPHFGLQELLTWGAFTYPLAFLINDITNRKFGRAAAIKVVGFGFLIAVVLSIYFATPRIAIASGSAFLVAQLIDVGVFDRLREKVWWMPPMVSTIIGSAVDTVLFFGLAFAPMFAGIDGLFGFEDGSLGFPAGIFGIAMPLWASLAIGDFLVKMLVGLFALIPYGGYLKLSQARV